MSPLHPAALVTGGASGIGRAFCDLLCARGLHTVIVDRDHAAAETTAAALCASRRSAEACPADVTDEAALCALRDRLRQAEVRLSWLILCAGDVHVGTVTGLPDSSALHDDIETDLWGTILCCRVFLPLLADGSHVVMISSGFGLVGVAGYGAYCAAKAGAIAFGEALRREVLCRGIRVHVACPGDTDTPLLRRETAQQPAWMKVRSARYMTSSPEAMARRILNACRGSRFLVIVNPEVRFVALAKKLLPVSLYTMLIDRMFARPRREDLPP